MLNLKVQFYVYIFLIFSLILLIFNFNQSLLDIYFKQIIPKISQKEVFFLQLHIL